MDSPVAPAMPSARRRAAAVLAALTLAVGGALIATTPASAATAGTIDDAQFSWGFNNEAGGGAFAGGCNFLSAGVAGNTGSSRPWTQADGFYSTSAGNVSIVKPNSTGGDVTPTWATKCQDANGTAVSAGNTASSTKNRVVISDGQGAIAADGSLTIQWTGSFSVVFYGGFTYWSATDPKLTLDAAGNGQVTATATGYGASMENPGVWDTLAPTNIVLANITAASVSDTGFTVTPNYLGVVVDTTGATAQVTTGVNAGAFPQSFVNFQKLTGQSSYWYSSGGSRDAAKPTTPLAVSYSVEAAPTGADDAQDIDVTVPVWVDDPSGQFGWSFADNSPANLGTAVQQGNEFVAEGEISSIAVTDTRAGGTTPYTWSLSGQVSDFVDGTKSFSADYLSWTPSVSNAGAGVTAGAPTTGLADSAVLASSTAAASATVDAELELRLPKATPAGAYSATLTITALS